MLAGVMILWYSEVVASVLFVAADIRRTPESPVLKWGFVIVTLFSGPVAALLYVLSCREPLPGTHAAYVRARWRQVVGSTMHCVAGDGVGILAAAAVTSQLGLPAWADLMAEYGLGFTFGWTVFQALFMRAMAGGNYGRSLRATFLPELVSMNGVMAGMAAVTVPWHQALGGMAGPEDPAFWLVMSMGLTLGSVVTYPINWWLVSSGLKHGMLTAQPAGVPVPLAAGLALAGSALSAAPQHRSTALQRRHQMPAVSEPGTTMPGPSMAHDGHEDHARGGEWPVVGALEKAQMISASVVVLGVGVAVAGTMGSLWAH